MLCLELILHYSRMTEGNNASTINAKLGVNIKTDFRRHESCNQLDHTADQLLLTVKMLIKLRFP